MKIPILILLLFFHVQLVLCSSFIKNIEIKTHDTLTFSIKLNGLIIKDELYLPFRFQQQSFIAEIKVELEKNDRKYKLQLLPSNDYQLVDSVVFLNQNSFLLKVKFTDILSSISPKLRFEITDNYNSTIDEIRLLPYTTTTLNFYNTDYELFLGEEKIIELYSNMPENLKFPSGWISTTDFDYRFHKVHSQIHLYVIPKSLGKKNLTLSLNTIRPDTVDGKNIVYKLKPLTINFTIKSGRLAFLQLDKKELTYDEKARREGIEVQIDNHRSLLIKKTYRIENQESPGGTLIGELYTRQNLNNDKVLCWLRLYNLHRPTEGYLYIKDGDEAKFITNFGVSPQTFIRKISILRNGIDWIESNVVFPGEFINVRLEGEGMEKAKFKFEEIDFVIQDTIVKTDFAVEFKIRIPHNITKKKIFIYNHSENTGNFLQIKEYQNPRKLDFISVDYGKGPKNVEAYTAPELFDKTLKNIIISLNPEKIDEKTKFYGKQYIDVSVKITGSKGELIEIVKLPTICVCPGDNSLRHAFYDLKDCTKENISLNNFLDRKTYDFDDWTRIRLTFSHIKDKYTEVPKEKTVEIILQRKIKFDIDVSFPSLLTKVVKDDKWQNSLGVSMAIIAQLSFYQKDKIARFMPYKIGAGFLALNAFNFNDNNNTRDLGLVILGSVHPTRRDTKFSFPLYLGGGYLLNKGSWFWVFGPGIRVSF